MCASSPSLCIYTCKCIVCRVERSIVKRWPQASRCTGFIDSDLFPSSSINGRCAGCGHGTDERLKLWRVWKMETRLLHSKNAGCKSKLDTIYLLYMANSLATGLAPNRFCCCWCCLSRRRTLGRPTRTPRTRHILRNNTYTRTYTHTYVRKRKEENTII